MNRRRASGSVYEKAMVPNELIGLVLAAIVLVTAASVMYNFGPFITGGGKSQIAEDNFNSLSAELQRIASRSEPFVAVERFLYSLGDERNSLIGFDAGGKETTTSGVLCLKSRQKPTECGSKACICLFGSSMNTSPGSDYAENVKGLVSCRKIEGITTINSIPEQTASERESNQVITALNMGETRQKKTLIKSLPPNMQATNYLYIIRKETTLCGQFSIYTRLRQMAEPNYENTPLYIEKVVIDGTAHLTISPSTTLTKQRMDKARILIGITPDTIASRIAAGDYSTAILDTKAWLEANPSAKQEETLAMLILQARAFQRISEMDAKTVDYMLEKTGLKAPLPAQADKHAGLFAIMAYRAAIEPMNTKGLAQKEQAQREQIALAVLEGFKLCQRLKAYRPEIESDLLPFFAKQAENLPSGTLAADFIKARQAAVSNAPEAEGLLSGFIQASPADEESKEARYLLARIQEAKGEIPDAVSTYQQALRGSAEGQRMPDGTTIYAKDEIARICRDKISTQDIYEVCSAVIPETSCPSVTLVLLPKEACVQELIDENRCIASPEVAAAFLNAQQDAKQQGKTLEIVSAYRTVEQQKVLYDAYKKGVGPLAAAPSCAAPHLQGKAIDIRFKGEDMGSQPLDDMINPNRKLLETIMCKAGFIRLKAEYWHYEIGTQRATKNPGRCSA